MSNCGRCGHAGLDHVIGGHCRVWGCVCGGYKFADYQDEPSQRIAADHTVGRVENTVITELRKFLPEWGYPSYVIAAICLELKERIPNQPHDHGLVCQPEQSLRCSLCGETYFICKVCHGDVYGHHAKCVGHDR